MNLPQITFWCVKDFGSFLGLSNRRSMVYQNIGCLSPLPFCLNTPTDTITQKLLMYHSKDHEYFDFESGRFFKDQTFRTGPKSIRSHFPSRRRINTNLNFQPWQMRGWKDPPWSRTLLVIYGGDRSPILSFTSWMRISHFRRSYYSSDRILRRQCLSGGLLSRRRRFRILAYSHGLAHQISYQSILKMFNSVTRSSMAQDMEIKGRFLLWHFF